MWHEEGYFRAARDFAWTVPLGHAALLATAGLIVALVNRVRPRGISPRVALWLFAALAIWGPLLRMPMYGWCTFIFAVGLGRVIADAVIARGFNPPRLRRALAAVLGVLAVLAALTSGRQVLAEHRQVASLPPAHCWRRPTSC